MSTNISKLSSNIDNSLELVKKLSFINNNQVLVSLDVISLFTNIPIVSQKDGDSFLESVVFRRIPNNCFFRFKLYLFFIWQSYVQTNF